MGEQAIRVHHDCECCVQHHDNHNERDDNRLKYSGDDGVEVGTPARNVNQIRKHARPSEEHVGADDFALDRQESVRFADRLVQVHAVCGRDGAGVIDAASA